MTEIKQSTATRALVFKLVATSDGYTAITGATPTVQIRKEGGSFSSPAGAVTEIANGFYQVAANATDTNTLGTLLLHAIATGARPADMAYDVVANTAADISAAIAALNNISAAAAATAVRSELATEMARIDTTISSRNATAPPTAAAIADAVWDEATSGHVAAGSTGAAIVAAGSAGDPWSSSLPGAYGAGTAGNIIGNRIDAAISSRSSHTAAQVWSVATRALTTQSDSAGVTTLLARIASALTITGGKVTVAANEDKTGYALVTAPPSAAATATAVRSELATELARIDATVSSRNATAPDNAGIAAIKAKTDNLPSDPADQSLIIAATDAVMSRLGAPAGASISADIAAIEGGGGGGGGATAEEIADAVWDELLAGHTTPGSAGAAMSAAGASGDPMSVLVPGSYADGTAGAAIGRLNTVPGDGAVIVIPDPTEDPGQCVLFVSTRDIDGVAVPGVRIRVQPRGGPATTAGGQLVGMIARDMVTDQDGFATMIVERPDLLTPANVVTYEITAARYNLSETIAPTTGVYNLADLIS